MPQMYAMPICATKPISLIRPCGLTTGVYLNAQVTVLWQVSGVDIWTPGAFTAVQVVGGALTIPTSEQVWLLVAVKGDPTHGYLFQESDYGNIDTIFGTPAKTWAALYRINGAEIALFQQAGSGAGTITGDMLYWDNTAHAWVILHIS